MNHTQPVMASVEEETDDDYHGLPSPQQLIFRQKRTSTVSSLGSEAGDEAAGRAEKKDDDIEEGTITPPPPISKSSSEASSVEYSSRYSPLSRPAELEEARLSRASSRQALARRLGQLAEQLTAWDGPVDMDEADLSNHIDRLEKIISRHSHKSQHPSPFRIHLRGRPIPQEPPSPSYQGSYQRSRSVSADLRSQSDISHNSTNPPKLTAGHLDIATQSSAAEDPEFAAARKRTKTKESSLSVEQADKIISEINGFNDELTVLVNNLRARQEESDHIHGLLIDRAERAAQRILFLQTRISGLENELRENDDELQHLRICLKAIEVQMPPHPDLELQQCIQTIKQDFQALKKKRVDRSSIVSNEGADEISPEGGSGEDVSPHTPTPSRRTFKLKMENIRREW